LWLWEQLTGPQVSRCSFYARGLDPYGLAARLERRPDAVLAAAFSALLAGRPVADAMKTLCRDGGVRPDRSRTVPMR